MEEKGERMILESQEEKDAFEFVCNLASELTDRRICNDLETQDLVKFKHLKVKGDDFDGTPIERNVSYDGDVIFWLKNQIRD